MYLCSILQTFFHFHCLIGNIYGKCTLIVDVKSTLRMKTAVNLAEKEAYIHTYKLIMHKKHINVNVFTSTYTMIMNIFNHRHEYPLPR